MTGPVEWAVLIFMGVLVLGAMGFAWRTRGLIADRDIDIELLKKDVRHLKGNLAQHSEIFADMHDDFLKVGFEVERLAKIVNGKH